MRKKQKQRQHLNISWFSLQRHGPHGAREGVAADVHYVRRRSAPGTCAYTVCRQCRGKIVLEQYSKIITK
jgi:hypothetical protein